MIICLSRNSFLLLEYFTRTRRILQQTDVTSASSDLSLRTTFGQNIPVAWHGSCFSNTKSFYGKFIIKPNPVKCFQNANIHCRVAEDTVRMTHQRQSPAGALRGLQFPDRQDHC